MVIYSGKTNEKSPLNKSKKKVRAKWFTSKSMLSIFEFRENPRKTPNLHFLGWKCLDLPEGGWKNIGKRSSF